jgi:hypothetical protein
VNNVLTSAGLDLFRDSWGGQQMIDLLGKNGSCMLVNWPVGVGKSRNIDDVVGAAFNGGVYDVVVVLAPTKQIINERRYVRDPPADIRLVVLKPRPAERCGESRDAQWNIYESRGLGLLGRQQICGNCPHNNHCFWPSQYGKKLKGVQLVFATQAQLECNPSFLQQLQHWTGAERMLTILDEDNVILKCFRYRVNRDDLIMFNEVLAKLDLKDPMLARWKEVSSALQFIRKTDDLRHRGWRLPRLRPDLAVRVQEAGRAEFGDRFRFIGFDVQRLGHSPFQSRELHFNGEITFASPPRTDADLLVYSGTLIPEFCEFRLGIKLADPFKNYCFNHPGTHWSNIANLIGAKKYFARNSDQVLDFFAGLVARRMREGRRPLLISKKCFIPLCTKGLTERLKRFGFDNIRIVSSGWDKQDLNDVNVIPIINYGVIGVNLFNDFDCAFCLNSYFVNAEVINHIVQDVVASDGYVLIQIHTAGMPIRRTVKVMDSKYELCDVPLLANQALQQKELDVVVQAVGRVRPFTQPREVITFQATEHPLIEYQQEFSTLAEAREFFDIPTARAMGAETTAEQVQAMKAAGKSQAETAKAVGKSPSTVKRSWNRGGVTNP